jgi:hypothetical protein
MPTHNGHRRSRRLNTGWPVPAETGTVYTLHFAEPIGDLDSPRGHAQHYTGWSAELAGRLAAHWDGTCGVPLVQAFRRAGIPFAVVAAERGVTRARENQLKLHGAARRCPVCRGRATLLTEQAQTRTDGDNDGRHQDHHDPVRAGAGCGT